MIFAIQIHWVQRPPTGIGGATWDGTGKAFDTVTHTIVPYSTVYYQGIPDPIPRDIVLPAVGDLIHFECGPAPDYDKTNWFYGVNDTVTSSIEPNSPVCGYAPPLACNLSTLTVSQVATIAGMTVTAAFTGSSNGTAYFQLDNTPEQTSPVFLGVAAGAHTMQVRDSGLAGCTRTLSFTVQPGGLLPPAPTGPSRRIDFVGQPLWHQMSLPLFVGATVELELWAESSHGAADFAPVLTLTKRVNDQGEVTFRLDTLLWPLLRPFVPELALSGATQVCTPNLLDYYLRLTTTPLDPLLPPLYGVSELRTALRGGLPAEWQDRDYFALRLSTQFALPPFLSWQPTGPGTYAQGAAKTLVAGQPEWLFFLCPPALAGQALQVSRSYAMSAKARPVIDLEPLATPASDWPHQLLAIPLHGARQGFNLLTVQVETTAGVAVSLPANYEFVERSPQARFLLFTNSLGGVDTLRTTEQARLEITLEATTEKVERPARWGEPAPAADRQVSDLAASRKLRLATGWLWPAELDWLQELVLTREVWHQVGPQLRPLDWPKRSLLPYSDEPGLRGLLLECDYAYAPTAYAPVFYA